MGIIQEYLLLQKKYELEKGERTVVLMQIGTFYEIYEYDPSYCTSETAKVDNDGQLWDENIGVAVQVSGILNSVLTQENKNEPYGINNPHKMGFPIISYQKNLANLLANDFTVVPVNQNKDAMGKITRTIDKIESPTMQIDNVTLNRMTSNVVCIYIEYLQGTNTNGLNEKEPKEKYENFVITTGVAVIDILTGANRVCEFYSKAEDQIYAVQELYRFLVAHSPREIILFINDLPAGLDYHTEQQPNPYFTFLEKILELKRFHRVNVKINAVMEEYKKIAYQTEFINKIFNKLPNIKRSKLNIIQQRNDKIIIDLGLERMDYGRIAYMLLIQHCYSNNPDIVSKLSYPDIQWIDANKHLVLTHNAIVQLDLVPSNPNISSTRKKKEIDSLMSVLDENQTHLGRRLLYTLLQNPMYDSKEITTYYDMVSEMLHENNGEALWLTLDRQLKELPDISRLHRKLMVKLMNPKELVVLYNSYVKIINIYITIIKTASPVLHTQLLTPEDITNFNQYLAKYNGIFDFTALECCNINISSDTNQKWMDFIDNPVRLGHYPDLDESAQGLIQAENKLEDIVVYLNRFIEHTKGQKIQFKNEKKKQGAKKQEPTATVLVTTAAKAKILINANIDITLCGKLNIGTYSSTDCIITSDIIDALCQKIDAIRAWMRQRLLNIFESIIDEMGIQYSFYSGLTNLIGKIDLIHSYAKVSTKYNYHRPKLNDSKLNNNTNNTNTNNTNSYLDAKEIRHPIIERIIDGAYIPNDVVLNNNGILLYGVNQVGKSSLAKAIPLNIIMAQIGCFTACHLTYKPFAKIITRLSGDDNIYKGDSSFAVEMSELRTILRQGDENTLVLGDELCRGTENHSGMALTGSAILSLIRQKTAFIFATHMHELLDLETIKAIPQDKLRIQHLAISYDEMNKILIYDRKLRDGPGLSSYGLMVARSLNLPEIFLNDANNLLAEITHSKRNILEPEVSRYNNKVFLDECIKCKRNKHEVEFHTHHIQHQSEANDKGLIGNIHKNIKDNLSVLCKECHANEHKLGGELEVLTTSLGKLTILK